MKKIIGIIHPFDLKQFFYVYEDGNKVAAMNTTIDKIPEVIYNLSKQYDVYQVNLSGAKHFCNGIIKQVQQIESNKYDENKIVIKCI